MSFKDHLVYSRVPIVLGAVLLMVVAVVYTEVPFFSFASLASIACGTLSIYSIYAFNSWTDLGEDRVNSPDMATVSSRSKLPILAMSLASGITAAALSMFLGAIATATILLTLIVGLLYSVPLLRVIRIPRLKEIPLLKNLVIALLWAALVTVPLSASGILMDPVEGLLVVFVFLQFLIETISRDLPDARGDAEAGFSTFPSAFGPRRTLALMLIMNTMSAAVVIAAATMAPFISLILIGCAWRYYSLCRALGEKPLALTFAKVNFPTFLAIAVTAILGKLFV